MDALPFPVIPGVEFREIPGYEWYIAGSDGSIWSRRNTHGVCNRWRRLKLTIASGLRSDKKTKKTPYVMVSLAGRSRCAHIYVLLAFRGPCPDGMETRHLNGVAYDNRIENLEYGTPKQNAADKLAHGTSPRGEGSGRARLSATQVLEILKRLESGETFMSLATEFDVAKTTIQGISNGSNWWHLKHNYTPRRGKRTGEHHAGARLSEKQVVEIREKSQAGVSQGKLAAECGVNGGTINCIVHRRTWKHVA